MRVIGVVFLIWICIGKSVGDKQEDVIDTLILESDFETQDL